MNLFKNRKRIMEYFWKRRNELITRAFWKKACISMIKELDFLNKVSEKDFYLNLKTIEKKPWNLNIELTNICNANCIFCAYQFQTRKKLVMTDEIYLKALNEYCEMGGGELMLEVTVGEPTLDKNLIKRIKEARSKKEITTIETITNGIFLDKVGIEEFLNSGITRILISVSALDEVIYNKLYRNKNYKRLKLNIFNLLKLNKEFGEPVEITLIFKSNLTMKKTLELPDYQPLKKFPHKVLFTIDFDNWAGLIKQEDLLDGMYMRYRGEPEKEPCFWLYHGPIIYADGKMGLCGCRDLNANSELIVGDIKTDRIIDIWQSKKVKELRERYNKGEFPNICQKCTNYCNLELYRRKTGNERRYFIQKVFKDNLYKSPLSETIKNDTKRLR